MSARLAAILCLLVTPAQAEGPASSPQSAASLGWEGDWFGYVRAGYEHVTDDEDFEFVGDNNGFILHNARLGYDGWHEVTGLSYRISFEGAVSEHTRPNSPQGNLDVRAKDAYLRWDPIPQFGVTVGQFKAPFIAEDLRSTGSLLFSSRAVGVEGVGRNRGFDQQGLSIDRQIGLMLSPKDLKIGSYVGLGYYIAVVNGNGPNQTLNDNSKPAYAGRLEVKFGENGVLGGGVWMNDRTSGELPNLNEEKDFGIAADFLATAWGAELFVQFVQLKTEFETVAGTPERTQQALSAQVGYDIKIPLGTITPAYRYATFDPWKDGGAADAGVSLESFKLQYHTLGLKMLNPNEDMTLYVNYTLTMEEDGRELDNDRLEVLAQVTF